MPMDKKDHECVALFGNKQSLNQSSITASQIKFSNNKKEIIWHG